MLFGSLMAIIILIQMVCLGERVLETFSADRQYYCVLWFPIPLIYEQGISLLELAERAYLLYQKQDRAKQRALLQTL
jgi:hypothetical protein